jgi:short-subunit dehydrogenase
MHSDMFSVITGASDGIGREFALQLAKAGFNVLLAARNRDMLATLAEEIGTNTIHGHIFSSYWYVR